MPFPALLQSLQQQVSSVDKTVMEAGITQLQQLTAQTYGLPIEQQKEIYRAVKDSIKHTTTNIVSNIGLVKLPPAIQDKVVSMEFAQDGLPYTYSIISVNNVLTLTITSTFEETEIEKRIKARLENPLSA